LALASVPARSQSESSLRGRIESDRAREQSLSGAIAQLDGLLGRVRGEVAIVQGRIAAVESDLAAAEARLQQTRADLVRERVELLRLRRRLADGRARLAAQLVRDYKADPPDIVSLVLGSSSFADLLDRVEFARRIQRRNAHVLDVVRQARDETRREAARLDRLEAQQTERADAVRQRRDALASMRAGLAQRQASLERARAARAAALAGTRAGRAQAERELARLIAARQRAAVSQAGPGGPWAIPWPIVQCESGGQNLPPNSAGASGYYQFIRDTWRRLGGSTPNAYQAPKPEQDRLAAQLWAGGAGARNWVCAGLVGR
jgi:septal ring factor EnvC (AmiA/AmiB activator)